MFKPAANKTINSNNSTGLYSYMTFRHANYNNKTAFDIKKIQSGILNALLQKSFSQGQANNNYVIYSTQEAAVNSLQNLVPPGAKNFAYIVQLTGDVTTVKACIKNGKFNESISTVTDYQNIIHPAAGHTPALNRR